MTRTAKFKLAYLVVMLILALIAGSLFLFLGGHLVVVLAIALLLFIPGRVQAYYYRDLFKGRRYLDLGCPEKAIPCLEQFIASIQKHPNRSKLLWLTWAIYTPNVLAMATNNLGVAQLELGQLNDAEKAFSSAIEQDRLYPLPFYNMAIVHELRGNRSQATETLDKAQELGYTGGSLDKVINKSQSLLALAEGRSSNL